MKQLKKRKKGNKTVLHQMHKRILEDKKMTKEKG